MAYVNLMELISGNHVQEQFHDRFNILEGDSEVSGSPCLSQEETTGSVDRKGQYDDADWFNENPNRAGGTAAARTDATVAQYCSYIKGILTKNWAVSNQPAVKVSVLGYPSRLVKVTDNKDTTWIRLVCLVLQLSSRPDCDVFVQIVS